jgi:8-oxo-dGTP pyrophosphatase MutT (NUDIX family)
MEGLAQQIALSLSRADSNNPEREIESQRPSRTHSVPASAPTIASAAELIPVLGRSVGLVQVFQNFAACQTEILKEVGQSKSIKIFVQMGKSVLSGAAIIYNALERSRQDAEIKILHSGIDSPYLSERVARNRESNYREWREDINYATSLGSRLQAHLGSRLALRRHSEGYVFRFFLFDDHVYLQPYIYPSNNAHRAPVLKFARHQSLEGVDRDLNPNSLYHMLANYFDLKWEECAPTPTRLADMIPAGDPTAVAALVERSGIWVFVIPKRFTKIEDAELPFHSIGGKCDPGEPWIDSLQREAQEEIGAQLEIKSSDVTRDITTSAEFDSLHLSDSPQPYCVYKRTRSVDPEVVEPDVLWIVGYEASLAPDVEIEPRSEIAAIVYLSPDMLRRTVRETITYDQIRTARDGSGLQVQPGFPFNFGRIAAPTGLAALPALRGEPSKQR